jgi:hypothetical protein
MRTDPVGSGRWRIARGRRRVAGWRRWLGLALLVLVLAAVIGYRELTRESRLRRAAEAWLQDFTGAEAHIDHVRFAPSRGLCLTGVTLAVPESSRFDAHDDSLASRTIFRAAALSVRIRPFSLISGNLVVPEIVAIDPELTLVRRMSDGVGNWAAMLSRRKPKKGWNRSSQLPVVRLRNAKLTQLRLEDGARTGGAPQYVYAEARPVVGFPARYEVDIARGSELPASADAEDESGRLQIDLSPFAVTGGRLPFMSIREELLFVAPPEIGHWVEVLSLDGRVRPEAFSYDPHTRSRATLTLRDASFSIPVDSDERKVRPEQRYVRFSKMAGTIGFDGTRASVALNGRFQGGTLEMNGGLTLPEDASSGLSGIGFDLTLKVNGVPLPRKDQTADPSEVRFVERWKKLAEFVEDYDGLGNVDLEVKIRKPPGRTGEVSLVDATLSPRGTSGRYFRFPYRLYGLTGQVHFRSDGWIELHDLTGTHGLGRVVINGLVGGYASKAAKLDIRGQSVELDQELLRCLPERDQALCKQFAARVRMDLHVRLERADYPPSGPPAPWHSVLDVAFTDGSVSFAGFPYPLGQLSGHMRIEDGRFQMDDLSASRGEAKVWINGTATRSDEGQGGVDLKLKATNVPLDDVLAAALPAEAHERYTGFDPSGKLDVTGRLFTSSAHDEVGYDLTASLAGASLEVPGTSARLTGVGARLRVTPEMLEVQSLHGTFGTSPIELQAGMGLIGADPGMRLHLTSPGLALDDSVRAVLPASLQAVWSTFSPHGTAAIDVRYQKPPVALQPAASAPARTDYTIRIEPKDCQATFARFPLPMTEINGAIEVTPAKVSFESLTARHGKGQVQFSGCISLDPDGVSGTLSGSVEDLAFSGALRKALPWRLQKMWDDIQPEGTVSLSIEELGFDMPSGKPANWRFAGRAGLDALGLSAGSRLTDMHGELIAHGSFGPTLSLVGGLALERVRIDGRLMTDVTAYLSRPPDTPVLRVSDLVGQFCGGTLIGQAEVDYAPDVPKYGLSLSTRDVSLDRFLNDDRGPDHKPVRIKGQVEANLTLAGQLGVTDSRQGGGSIVIREAQMLKVPLMLKIMQVVHLAIGDDNAFQDGMFSFIVEGDEVLLTEIDLRGKAFSMVGAGRVRISNGIMHLVLLVGSPLRLPRIAVLSELLEGVARELMEVHVEGTLEHPTYRAELVRSVKSTLERILNIRAAARP